MDILWRMQGKNSVKTEVKEEDPSMEEDDRGVAGPGSQGVNVGQTYMANYRKKCPASYSSAAYRGTGGKSGGD